MPLTADVLDLIRRARMGDEAASADLVHKIEPFIQRVVRFRMERRCDYDRLRRDVGCSDVCQSVFRSLFRGLRENRYKLDQPGDLERLLQVMVRFNVATKARRSHVRLRELLDEFEEGGWTDDGPSPDHDVSQRDLIEAIQDQFSEEELRMLTLWLDDTPWADIGQGVGCTADAARVRLGRAVTRVRDKMRGDSPNES
jgi:DNA-directed RNA polymerase specialized sigma24 family protein